LKKHNKFTPLVLFVFLVCPICVFLIGAQSGSTGAVKGFVKDAETGRALAKAKIILVYSKNETVKYELQTDKEGSFYKAALTPGYYHFTVEKDEFMPTSKTVRVRLSRTEQVDFELQTLASQVPEAIKKVDKAMKLFREEKWEDAVREFSEGITEDHANPLLFYYRGIAHENNGDAEEALSDYQKAIELKPDFVLPYSRAGKIYARQHDYEKAGEFYQKSVELGDQDITTLYNYGVVLINLGKSPEAKAVFENLLLLDEDYPDAYYHLGIIAIGQGDSERAKELLQKLIALDPENINAPIAKKIIESLK